MSHPPEEFDQYGLGTEEERREYREQWSRELQRGSLGAYEAAARMDPDNYEKWQVLASVQASVLIQRFSRQSR